jgi:hypothetical protein
VLSVDEKSQIQALDRTQPIYASILPIGDSELDPNNNCDRCFAENRVNRRDLNGSGFSGFGPNVNGAQSTCVLELKRIVSDDVTWARQIQMNRAGHGGPGVTVAVDDPKGKTCRIGSVCLELPIVCLQPKAIYGSIRREATRQDAGVPNVSIDPQFTTLDNGLANIEVKRRVPKVRKSGPIRVKGRTVRSTH